VNYHFIGVGGIGMSALAGYLLGEGHHVSGSDLNENEYVKKLIKKGLCFKGNHRAENIQAEIETVIITSAIDSKNEELIAAQAASKKIIKRGQFLAELIVKMQVIAISGSHGKTTTSGLVAHLLQELNLHPSFILGGTYKNMETHFHKGKSSLCVVEADESDRSFLYLNPTILSINNIDNDHLDNYGSMENLIDAFSQFAQKVKPANQIINMNCLQLKKMFQNSNCFKVGIKTPSVDLMLEEVSINKNGTVVKIEFQNKLYEAQFALWGQHNLENLAVALGCVVPFEPNIEKIFPHLATFKGMKRRMDKIGEFDHNFIYDDYAHHPSEILALYNMSQKIFTNPLIVHQPHRYSRVQSCWTEYIDVLKKIKNLKLMDIYPAGEKPLVGINSTEILNVLKIDDSPLINLSELNPLLKNYDAIVFCGAGSISEMARKWVNENTTR